MTNHTSSRLKNAGGGNDNAEKDDWGYKENGIRNECIKGMIKVELTGKIS